MFRSSAGARRPAILLIMVAVVLSLIGSGLSAAGSAQSATDELIVDFQNEDSAHEEQFDTRSGSVAPSSAQQAAVAQLGAEVQWNRFGTPSSLIKYGGFLASGISAKSAEAAARAWVDANAALFRLGSSDSLELASSSRLKGTNGYVVNYSQVVDGLVVSPEGSLSVGVKGSARHGWKVAYVSSSVVSDAAGVKGTPRLSATSAFVSAARDVDAGIAAGDLDRDGRRGAWTALDVEGSDETQLVRSIAFPTMDRGLVRAFETSYYDGADEGFQHIIDAQTGEVLFRANTVHQALDEDNPEWKVFPSWPNTTPLNAFPWNYPSNDIRQVWCWEAQQGCNRAIGNPASPAGWDTDAVTGTPTNTTVGNNNNAAEAWVISGGFPVPPSGYRPVSPTRDYIYDWTNEWFNEGCNPSTFVIGSGNDIDAATVNLFVMHNRMHDWTYNLGFTEANWNGQDFNFGKGGLGGDALNGRVQSGAVQPGSRDNANMSTQPDGTPSRTNMFMWQPIAGGFYAPCVDGDYDMAVIAHEFGHMVENRMIGKGNRRSGFHAGAMGESVSDLIAMEYLNEYGFVTDGDQRFAVGPYVTGNSSEAIRNYNMSWQSAGRFPAEARKHDVNPLNFSDIGYDIVGPQVHATGEIWSATNFDLRSLLNQRYGSGNPNVQRQCADGELPATSCPGNRRWIQLMFDSFLMQPIAPTMLDARNAILAADVMRFGGTNQDLLWLGFARRGFGSAASVTGTDDVLPVPGWESPLHDEATLTFEAFAKDEGGAAITDFDVFVGDYEARSVPIDTSEAFVPGPQRGYNFVAVAPGYGHVRFAVRNLLPNESRTISIHFPTNWASQSKGATASGDGANFGDLIDDAEGTTWESTSGAVEGKQVVIALDGEQSFDLAKASALLEPGQNRFTALRQFELQTCTAGGPENPSCDGSVSEGWTSVLVSDSAAFPGINPRPVGPELQLRAFVVEGVASATHVKFIVLNNQCTGQPSFQGEQDQDPGNATDCRGTVVAEQVRAAELQLLSSEAAVDGAYMAE